MGKFTPSTKSIVSFESQTAQPLDTKHWFTDLTDLQDITINNNPLNYYEGMYAFQVDQGKVFRWIESTVGALTVGFTYPDPYSHDGVDYANKTFNFVEVNKSVYIVPNGGNFPNVNETPIGSIAINEFTDTAVFIGIFELQANSPNAWVEIMRTSAPVNIASDEWDASVNAYPTTFKGGTINDGNSFYITAAGTMGSTVVNIGDLLVAKSDTPGQIDANWFVVESNRDQATENILGLAKIATQVETDAGTDDSKIVTPLKLENRLAAFNPGTTIDGIKNFRSVIPNSYCKEKEAREPYSVTPFDPTTDPMPVAEFEDCSQIYNPEVIEIGDYYFLYYIGNTQKFQTVYGDSPTTRQYSDFGRIDRVFMAYRKKSEGLHGEWQKWEDGTLPVLDIGAFDNVTLDGGNAWMSNVIYDGTQYIMAYTGDSQRTNTNHTFHPAIASSSDGINWTKQGFISGMSAAMRRGFMTYYSGTYYWFGNDFDTGHVVLYSTTTPFNMSSYTLINSDITGSLTTHYNRVWSVKLFDDIVYLTVSINTVQDEVILLSCPIANIANSSSYVDEGILIKGNPNFGESYNGLAATPSSLNYNCIFREDTNVWTVFYSYYKTRMARTPYVPETGIRSITFENTIPKPV